MINVADIPVVRAQLERAAAAKEAEPQAIQPPSAQATECSEIMQAIAAGLQVKARLWRRPEQCAVWAEHKCTGDQQACPFRR
jgi:hypothetical protein